jgi:RNA polymerase sigma factor (TIGR02999 family)
MNTPPPDGDEPDVTALLHAWNRGDGGAAQQVMDIVYKDLRRRAAARLRRERSGHTLSPTELVHEAYVRLTRQRSGWENRGQFFGLACEMMRRVLVDHARGRNAGKRAALRVTLHEGVAFAPDADLDLLSLDRALTELEAADARQARLVELRFFGGLSLEDAADALAVSHSTAKRDWRFARAWLFQRLKLDPHPAAGGAKSSIPQLR